MLPWAVLMVPRCELAGLYIHSNLENMLPKTNFELYRDDGLIILRNVNGQQTDKKGKSFPKTGAHLGFSEGRGPNFKKGANQ